MKNKNTIDSAYISLVKDVLKNGEMVKGRNGNMLITNFFNFTIYPEADTIPVLSYRKIHYPSAFGELAALLNGVKNESDFKKFGVNYWHKWSDQNGNLNLDYSNQLMENGQLQFVIDNLKKDKETNETGRKHLVSLWNYDNVKSGDLSLECCWELFIFTLVNGKLNMTFRMRSLDIFFGLPYDILLAWTLQRIVATELDVEIGVIDFAISNPHIYEEYIEDCKRLTLTTPCESSPKFKYTGDTVKNFNPKQMTITDYCYNEFSFDTEVKE